MKLEETWGNLGKLGETGGNLMKLEESEGNLKKWTCVHCPYNLLGCIEQIS